jgi:membrane-associated phospholipid phosphatase
MTHETRPVDAIVAGYNVFLAAIWMTVLSKAGYAPGIFAAHLAAAALPLFLSRAPHDLARPVAILREIYPLLFVLAFWTELGYLRELYHIGVHDQTVGAWDLRVFGQHFNLTWMPRMPQVWLSEVMHFIYYAYYPLIFIPVIAVGLMGRHTAMRDMTFRLAVTYLGCYVLYLWFPVDGPAALLPHYDGALTEGFFYQLVKHAHDSGDSLGTAFPSSHVAGSVTIAYLAWRWLPRGWAWLIVLETVGVCFATVYTQNHYAIDALGGLVWATVLQVVAVPLVRGVLSGAPAERFPIPVLPRFDVEAELSTGGGT